MLQSETGNNHCRTRVMSYQKRVGLAGDSHLHSLVRTFCLHFTENPLFIFNKILAIIMYIPPTFPFFFYDKNWLLSYVFFLSVLPWCLCHNYYKYLVIEEKKGASEGVVPPQKPGLPTFRNCLEGETLSAKRKNPWVGSRPAYSVWPLMGSRGKAPDRGPRHRSLV